MSVAKPKEFFMGVALMIAFIVVLIIFFLPIYGGGKNGLNYLDDLYNSISKDSAYYIPKLKEDSAQYAGNKITLSLNMKSDKEAMEAVPLLAKSEATVSVSGSKIDLSGDLGKILANCLADADTIFHNDANTIKTKYNIEPRKAGYTWYLILKALNKSLTDQSKFKEAKIIGIVTTKGVECAFNYYKVIPENITAKVGLVIFSLVFYVVYTMWYGYAILFMFEGWGLKIGH